MRSKVFASSNLVKEQIAANRAAAIIRRQASKERQLQRASPNETGYVDLAFASYGANTTGTITLIATIAQGAGVTQRIGKRAYYKSIQIRGAVDPNASTLTTKVAFIIVYDRRPTGALPAITDILVSASSVSFNNDNNSGRFQIVTRRDYFLIGNNATPNTSLSGVSIEEFIKFRREVVYKAAGTGAIGDIEQGALYLVTVGDKAAGATDADFFLGFRVRFTET